MVLLNRERFVFTILQKSQTYSGDHPLKLHADGRHVKISSSLQLLTGADARHGESPMILSKSNSCDRPEELQPAPCDGHILRLLTDLLTAAVWYLHAGQPALVQVAPSLEPSLTPRL